MCELPLSREFGAGATAVMPSVLFEAGSLVLDQSRTTSDRYSVSNLGGSIGWGLAVGASLLIGAAAAAILKLPGRLAAIVTSFGGGVLLAAIALELVPEADEQAGSWVTAVGLLAGTIVYVAADAWLSRDEGMEAMRRSSHAAAAGRPMTMAPGQADAARGESIAAGLVIDGVPESIALGLTIAEGEIGLALLVGILVGNVVEAYGAAQPIVAGGRTRRFAITLLGAIGLALAGATVLGGTVLADASPTLIGAAEAIAAGAVLAVVSISIIPYAFSEVSSEVATATVLGFVGGYLLS
jgi:zinc transporter, ZIP family